MSIDNEQKHSAPVAGDATGAELIMPYGDGRSKHEQVEQMFDSIAPAYDFMNRAMTMGVDKLWRRRAVRMVRRCAPQVILDVATGTGDLAIKMAKAIPGCKIKGIDLSQGMLEVGRRKVEEASLGERISFEVADCLSLPFAGDTFDCVTVAYGVRNFERLVDGYKEMYRVLKPGGLLCVLELGTPRGWLTGGFYKLYTKYIIPMVGRFISKDRRAYEYLPESISRVAQRDDMLALMREAGFEATRYVKMTFGTCIMYTGIKATSR